MPFSVSVAQYIIIVSATNYTSLDQPIIDTMSLWGIVNAPELITIVILDRACKPHTLH